MTASALPSAAGGTGFVLQGHLGAVCSNGQAHTARELPICEDFFHDLLTRLGTDYVDVINIQVVDRRDDYEQIMAAAGLLEAAQPGVSTVIPGVADADQLRAALAYVVASPAECEFESLLSDLEERLAGTCVYCNHCLPCPVGISIGDLMWALRAKDRGSEYAEQAYSELGAQGSACVECGDCMLRCPFGEVELRGGRT